jgi:hypothetical protein
VGNITRQFRNNHGLGGVFEKKLLIGLDSVKRRAMVGKEVEGTAVSVFLHRTPP